MRGCWRGYCLGRDPLQESDETSKEAMTVYISKLLVYKTGTGVQGIGHVNRLWSGGPNILGSQLCPRRAVVDHENVNSLRPSRLGVHPSLLFLSGFLAEVALRPAANPGSAGVRGRV